MEKRQIMEILTDWNFWGNYVDESILRENYLKILNELIKSKEIIVAKGVRRSGKSTLLYQFLKKKIENGLEGKNTLIVNFEDPRFPLLKAEDLVKIYETYLEELQPGKEQYVVLDEVQVVRGWEKFARYLKESKKVNVFVTGSSSKVLSEEFATLLAGRHVDMEILPLSFKEFLKFKKFEIESGIDLIKYRHRIKAFFKEYMEFGGFPKVTLVEKPERKKLLESYFDDIIIKDVTKRFNIRESDKLEELAKFYLTNISSLQSFNKLKNVLKLSLDSIERFSNYLSIARFLFFTSKFSFSMKEQILAVKKIYCIDVGLRNAISFRFSEDFGRLAENIVFLELFRRGNNIFYWRDYQQKEVDFIVNGKKLKNLIQVCWDIENEKVRNRETSSLIRAMKGFKFRNGLIITEDFEGEEKIGNKKIIYKPLWKWLLT